MIKTSGEIFRSAFKSAVEKGVSDEQISGALEIMSSTVKRYHNEETLPHESSQQDFAKKLLKLEKNN